MRPATRVAEAAVQASRLTAAQMERYSRQIILEEMGLEGQARLLRSKALIIGAGGLGSPTALYLAAAGVGTLGIVDGDRVDLTNLHRQILHATPAIGRAKTESARETLAAVQKMSKPEVFRKIRWENGTKLLGIPSQA